MRDPGGGREDDWTFMLLRRGGVEARSWNVGKWTAILLVGAATAGVLAAGVALGSWWADRRESAEIRELQARVDRLNREREGVLALGARIDSIEREYGQIRRIMGGDAVPNDREIRLPPGAEGRGPGAGASAGRERSEPTFHWPLARRGFVTRSHRGAAREESELHRGLDIAVPTGTYVRATRGGVVAEAGRDSVFGNFVRVAHEEGVVSLYAHNDWIFVSAGDTVEATEVIAVSGNSGRSTAPHLHFELQRDGRPVDPESVLGERG